MACWKRLTGLGPFLAEAGSWRPSSIMDIIMRSASPIDIAVEVGVISRGEPAMEGGALACIAADRNDRLLSAKAA